jgi:predicted negative regulator of RcsB-dependent stress response
VGSQRDSEDNVETPEYVTDDLHHVKQFFQQHGLRIVVNVVVAVAVIASVLFYRGCGSRREQQATSQLGTARSVQDLEAVVARYPSAAVAPVATLRLAKAYFDTGYYDLALAKYNEFGTRFGAHELARVAEMGRIHCTEAKGQVQEAAQAFKAFAAAHPTHYLAAQAIFGEARCLEQLGRLDDARVIYEDFVTRHPKSGWHSRAQEALETVNKKIKKQGSSPAAPVAAAATNAVSPTALVPLGPAAR